MGNMKDNIEIKRLKDLAGVSKKQKLDESVLNEQDSPAHAMIAAIKQNRPKDFALLAKNAEIDDMAELAEEIGGNTVTNFLRRNAAVIYPIVFPGGKVEYPLVPSGLSGWQFEDGNDIKTPAEYFKYINSRELADELVGIAYEPSRIERRFSGLDNITLQQLVRQNIDNIAELVSGWASREDFADFGYGRDMETLYGPEIVQAIVDRL